VQHPAAISCRVPPYPAEARREGKTGTVLLGLLIDETGAVTDRRIERTSGSEALDAAALTALSGCRFSPGTVDGRPHAAWARLRYVWKLN
jgi:protein TonB